MAFPSFDLGVNDINVFPDEYLYDSDSMDDILLTISPTALENRDTQFPDIPLEIPAAQLDTSKSDSVDDILLTISPTALENKDTQFQDTPLEIPAAQLDTSNTDDTSPIDEEDNNQEQPENEEPSDNELEQTEQNLRNFVQGNRNKNTTGKTKRETDRFKKFLISKNEQREMHHIPPDELNIYLGDFIKNLQKLNGENYEPDSVSSFFR